MHDVIVVGAGPSGSYAAMKCKEKGLSVLLIDKHRFPRDKACGGIVSGKTLQIIGGDVMSVVESNASTTDFYYNWKLIQSLERQNYFVKRRRFDNYLVQRAVDSGAEFKHGTNVTALTVEKDGAVVKTANEALKARIIIGADGANSIVSRYLGLSHHDDECRYASMKAEIDITPEKGEELGVFNPPKKKVYFFKDLVGFAWIVPNKDSVNAGYGSTVSKAGKLKERFHIFLNHFGLKPQLELGAQIPFLTLPLVYDNRILLTGDAAGFVNPWTGCGIEDGIIASEKAADMCKIAADSQDYSASLLRTYQDMCQDQIKRVRWRGSWIKALDRLIPNNSSFPFWTELVVKQAVHYA